jgi:hypothetical protein
MAIRVGHTTFRSTIADGSPLFRVIEKSGRGVYKCRVEDDEEDWAGTVKHFSTSEIEHSLRMANLFSSLGDRQQDFWARRTIGENLHYCNGFNQFVRGTVIELDGEKKFKPTALVGNWSKSDLPHRRENGNIVYGYHAKKIIEGGSEAVWQPNESCVYEEPTSSYRTRGIDPTSLPAIDLTLPPMTTEEQIHANKVLKLEEIAALIINRHKSDTTVDQVMEQVRKIAAL